MASMRTLTGVNGTFIAPIYRIFAFQANGRRQVSSSLDVCPNPEPISLEICRAYVFKFFFCSSSDPDHKTCLGRSYHPVVSRDDAPLDVPWSLGPWSSYHHHSPPSA